jgi:prepilin-type N-terminal cleavage/methylation domain-containing protein
LPRACENYKMRKLRGFTLIELMIVVAIVIVLAVVAINSYRKYSNSARKSEVYALFGEIRTKEEAYRAEFSRYAPAPAANNEDVYYPAGVNGKPLTWAPAPVEWNNLGISPGKPQVYCGYNVVTGTANVAGGLGARGTAWFGGAVPKTLWWYANAMCDNDENPAVNAQFLTSSDNTAVMEKNPQR